ncbi:MAG: ECF-type sigma factor, partial [Acidobacteriota bacterium]
LDELLPLVLRELRQLAEHHLRRSPSCPTLQPTALVNEAYLRLVGSPVRGFESRRQFFAFASKVLREVLVDHVRARGAKKRGGSGRLGQLEDASEVMIEIAVDAETVLSLHEALSKLEKLHERQARIVELRFFAGLTLAEIARALDWSEITVRRDWGVARRWLRREISRQRPPEPPAR